jgi:uncharacterized protein
MLRHPAVPYVLPFGIFLFFLALHPYNPLPVLVEQVVRVLILAAVVWWFSRPVLDFRLASPAASAAFGVAVFAAWILPDLLFPCYRGHWLFTNSVTGSVASSIPPDALRSPAVLLFRTLRAALLVPIIEELFWRGWLMRWLDNPDFEKVPFGRYAHQAFWVSAVLFASEHGPYWDVGLLAGAAYNFWAIRTKRLGDCILAHGVTNLCLSLYTIATGKWEYWL